MQSQGQLPWDIASQFVMMWALLQTGIMVEELTRLEISDNGQEQDGIDGVETESKEEFIEDAEGGEGMSKFVDN